MDELSRDAALYCSFCGKSQHEVQVLIRGPIPLICDECVGLCNGIIADHHAKKKAATRAALDQEGGRDG